MKEKTCGGCKKFEQSKLEDHGYCNEGRKDINKDVVSKSYLVHVSTSCWKTLDAPKPVTHVKEAA